MLNFIIRRVAQIPLVMLALSLLLFVIIFQLTPEQRAAGYIRSEQQAAQMDSIIRQRGLDKPFPIQYSKWLASTVQGDLGFSRTSSKPVLDTIKERLPSTIELSLYAGIPIVLLGIWLGTLSALNKDRFVDQFLRVIAVLGTSLPSFVLGIVLLKFLYGSLGWLPGPGQVDVLNQFAVLDPTFKHYTGMLSIDAMLNGRWAVAGDVLRHLVMPVLTLVIIFSANILKVMRAQMLETLTSDYVRTARAKGLGSKAVNLKHARRNALLPIVTLTGFVAINLLAGAIITETIFAYPGVGQWVGDAARNLDISAVMGFALLSAVIVVVISTLTDLFYGVVDPRVRFD
ncbi:ABC transporter permease [Deinococcus psychrotolerans]|uniref:ABC transporter permease n=2 Tax=Deinococcus TaxID=1298 RepID=A0A553V069_9DEIO|nr:MULTISPECIES: ABC transporter permease [Deinococcus]AZI42292.1 ABC transporter permease [Deinococcus psychrotolerans]TSA85849.1 ABC transporter permease [Deinococcus detaillensis]